MKAKALRTVAASAAITVGVLLAPAGIASASGSDDSTGCEYDWGTKTHLGKAWCKCHLKGKSAVLYASMR